LKNALARGTPEYREWHPGCRGTSVGNLCNNLLYSKRHKRNDHRHSLQSFALILTDLRQRYSKKTCVVPKQKCK